MTLRSNSKDNYLFRMQTSSGIHTKEWVDNVLKELLDAKRAYDEQASSHDYVFHIIGKAIADEIVYSGTKAHH